MTSKQSNGRIKQKYIPFAIATGEYAGTTPAPPRNIRG